MKSRIYTLLLLISTFIMSCSKEDDDTTDLENRMQALEERYKEMNTNISSLNTLVNALQQNDYIKEVTPIIENGKEIGFKITFLKNSPITICHGKEENTPQIGIKQDVDGIYYWTLNGEWLLNDSNGKIPAQGMTPKLKIEDDYWYVSYDNGSSWTQLDKATTSGGDSQIEVDTSNDTFVTFKLADGTIFNVPKCRDIDILFENTKDVILVPGKVQEIPYTLIGTSSNVKIEALGSNGIEVKVNINSPTEGTLSIVADKITNYSKVVVLEEINLPKITKVELFQLVGTTGTKIIKMESVKNIGDEAFAYNLKLETLELPNAEIIGNKAFYDCNSSLKNSQA